MALKISTARYGVTFSAAYAKIGDWRANYRDGMVKLDLDVYADEAARTNRVEVIDTMRFMASTAEIVAMQQPGDTDPRQPAYRWLKMHAALVNAVDVLEPST